MKKNILLTIIGLLIATSCGRTREEVALTYPNGKPRLVYTLTGSSEHPIHTGARMYYENGNIQFEKFYAGKDEQPTGEWKYYFDNGQLFASATFSKEHPSGWDWQFLNREGKPYHAEETDSVCVLNLGEFDTPATVAFFKDDKADIIQFYSNYTVRSSEQLVKDQRQGRVIFYHPNGIPQTEAYFTNGVEDGTYTVYRDNGIPYYRGQYQSGKRVGIWEFYDAEGNLIRTENFDAKK